MTPTRIGSRAGLALVLLAPLWAWGQAASISQTVDHRELGLQDTFTLTVLAENAPRDSELEFPSSPDFELLQRFESSQRTMEFVNGQSSFKEVVHYTLVMRPRRVGHLTIPPSKLRTSAGTLKSQPISMVVRPGTAGYQPPQMQPSTNQRRKLLDQLLGGAGADDDEAFRDLLNPMEERIPTSNSDLFLRARLDKTSAVVGEQAVYSLYVFTLVPLSSVENVVLPKMDGFWSENLESPSQLAETDQVLEGQHYHAYLVKRIALFPDHAGSLEIPAASAEIFAGNIIMGRQFHRDANALKLEVKPAPPGAPGDFRPEQVGEWKLSADVQPSDTELGQPVTVKVTLEGKGNLKRQVLPRLVASEGLKPYDPTTTDQLTTRGSSIGGKRVQEYLVMPQRTGSFTLPALRFSFFNPKVGRYQTSETQPMVIAVKPSTSGATSGVSPHDSTPKNVLTPGALHPVRAEAAFSVPGAPPWQRPWFLALTLAPVGLYLAAAGLTRVRSLRSVPDPAQQQRRKARDAQARLAHARKLLKGSPDEFYGEVERAVLGSLETKMGTPVLGLTHAELQRQMEQAGYAAPQRQRVMRVLEACQTARYAPGLAASAGRTQVLESAEAVMSGGDA